MTRAEYQKEVKKLIKKVDNLNTRCKGLVLNCDDLVLVQNHIGQLEATLQRNTIGALQNKIAELRDTTEKLSRRAI